MKKTLAFLPLALLLSSCATGALPPENYANRGDPEASLDVSSEVVNISLDTPKARAEILDWLRHEQPVRAEIMCETASACTPAKQLLDQYGVKYARKEGAGNSVNLMYERVIARDCDPRYIDNYRNPYGVNHASFGCAVKANMVQSVTQKRQFVNPALADYPDGEKAVSAYQKYLAPSTDTTEDSLLQSSSSSN